MTNNNKPFENIGKIPLVIDKNKNDLGGWILTRVCPCCHSDKIKEVIITEFQTACFCDICCKNFSTYYYRIFNPHDQQ